MNHFKSLWPVTALSLLVFSAPVTGQEGTGTSPFWECELPGGNYLVRVSSISSVSVHEYLVDGTTRVTEVTVASVSSVVARFYHIEPPIPKSPIGAGQSIIDHAQEKLEEVAARIDDQAIWQRVVKSYPVATHAHTVEYRIIKKKDIKKIYRSLRNACKNGVGRVLKISDNED